MNASLCVVAASGLTMASLWLLVLAGSAGPDPVKYSLHSLGVVAASALVATLAVSTLARITRRPQFMIWRRPLGLASFFFATLHAAMYVWYQGASAAFIAEDVSERPFVLFGFIAWLLLIPLAATSSRSARRRLGVNWTRLHRTVYVIAILAVVHQVMANKTLIQLPLILSVILALLLLERFLRNWSKLERLFRR